MRGVGRIACASVVSLIALLDGRVAAQEYCVTCTEPSRLYRCIIEGAQPRGGQPLQLLCVTAMAKEGGHATCAIKSGTVFECSGAVKRVPWAALDTPQREAAQPAATQPAAQPGAPDTPGPAQDAPQTVVDLAKQANEKAVAQVKKAGETVKDATKKTWDCVFSLFTRC